MAEENYDPMVPMTMYQLPLEQDQAAELLKLLTVAVVNMQKTEACFKKPKMFLALSSTRMKLAGMVHPGSVIEETMEIKGDGG